MKYSRVVNAFNILKKLINMDFCVRDAYKIFRLYKELEPTIEFGAERERALIEKYNGKITQDGRIEFIHDDRKESKEAGIENLLNFKREINDLNGMDIDIQFTPIVLSFDAFGEQYIKGMDILSLDGFVSFE